MAKEIKRVIAYCRVSTNNQKDEGTIEIQHNAIAEYVSKQGYELVKAFSDDGISGGLEDRPALSALFDYIEENKDIQAVVIFKLDRLARDLYIQEHLIKQFEKLDVNLLSLKEPDLSSSDPMRKAFRQFMGIVSELEKSFITMRMSGGRINKARKGGYAGGFTALGYKSKNKELQIDKEQADTVRAIFHMKRYKRKGLREIARELNKQGVPTARGGKWYAGTVKYILNNSLYKGILSYKDEQSTREDLALLTKA
jgi:site-specific DNA recombinase